jgi:hypothetical protein
LQETYLTLQSSYLTLFWPIYHIFDDICVVMIGSWMCDDEVLCVVVLGVMV